MNMNTWWSGFAAGAAVGTCLLSGSVIASIVAVALTFIINYPAIKRTARRLLLGPHSPI
jgi:protein-S-isoprenylcysteine O-methyltransferase Ste14